MHIVALTYQPEFTVIRDPSCRRLSPPPRFSEKQCLKRMAKAISVVASVICNSPVHSLGPTTERKIETDVHNININRISLADVHQPLLGVQKHRYLER